jgi:hypothetical protein
MLTSRNRVKTLSDFAKQARAERLDTNMVPKPPVKEKAEKMESLSNGATTPTPTPTPTPIENVASPMNRLSNVRKAEKIADKREALEGLPTEEQPRKGSLFTTVAILAVFGVAGLLAWKYFKKRQEGAQV